MRQILFLALLAVSLYLKKYDVAFVPICTFCHKEQ